jgi:probable phosphoglycerate mutase
LVPEVVEGLGERSWGEFEGRPLGERRQATRESAPTGGETWSQFSQRPLAAFQTFVGTPRTLVVAHSGTYRVLIEALLGEDPDGASVSNLADYRANFKNRLLLKLALRLWPNRGFRVALSKLPEF